MTAFTLLITAFWVIFLLVWLTTSFSAKRNVGRNPVWRVVRFIALVSIYVLIRSRVLDSRSPASHTTPTPENLAFFAIGTVLCGAGIGVAVWARMNLGRNWGMPMSIKENPELVTSGPYSRVRHPIYSGVLLALIGTALAFRTEWLAFLVLFDLVYFMFSASREERLMVTRFPDQYPAYQARTKKIIPFIW